MKKLLYRLLSLTVIAIFLLYWATSFILALPINYPKTIIRNKTPALSPIFISRWKLFTPCSPNNYRLYFIVRNVDDPQNSDTTEILEKNYFENPKQALPGKKAPLIDKLFFKNTMYLLMTLYGEGLANKPTHIDAAFIASKRDQFKSDGHLKRYLFNLNNYFLMTHKNVQVEIPREMKIIITEKKIRPFNEMKNKTNNPAENLIFETTYEIATP
jgi:hypothetical protein